MGKEKCVKKSLLIIIFQQSDVGLCFMLVMRVWLLGIPVCRGTRPLSTYSDNSGDRECYFFPSQESTTSSLPALPVFISQSDVENFDIVQ